MCLRNVSGTVCVIKMTSANRLTASGCIASRWVYRSIVNLLETPDGKFRDNMHTISFVRFRTQDSWHSNQPWVWNAKGIDIASNAEPVDTSVRWPQLQNKKKKTKFLDKNWGGKMPSTLKLGKNSQIYRILIFWVLGISRSKSTTPCQKVPQNIKKMIQKLFFKNLSKE